MTYKKLIIIFVAIFLLVPSVMAVADSDLYPYLIAQYAFEDGSGTTIVDNINSYDMFIADEGADSWETGMNGGAWQSGGTAYANTTNSAITHVSTLSVWFYLPDALTGHMLGFGKAGNVDDRFAVEEAGGSLRIDSYNDVGDIYPTGTLPGTGSWNHYCITTNTTHLIGYWNGSVEITNAWVYKIFSDSLTTFSIGAAVFDQGVGFKPVQPNNVRFDTIELFDKNLTSAECQYLFDKQGTALASTPPIVDTLNITATQPDNNTQWSVNTLEVNATITTNQTFNVSLYINGTINQTRNSVSAGTGVIVPFNLSFSSTEETELEYFFSADDGLTEENSTAKTFYVDVVSPNIDWGTPNNANYTVIYDDLNNNIVIADDNLYSYEYNITDSSNNLIWNLTNSSLTGSTSVTINDYVNFTNSSGIFNAVFRVCDGHTNNQINFLAMKTLNKELLFDNNVRISMEGTTLSSDFKREHDRYSFSFKPITSKNARTFVVESNDYIDILDGKTKYSGHLVTGNKWIDFEMAGIKSVSVSRISPYKVSVTVTTHKPISNYEFNSIGELNCRTETRTFFVTNSTQSHDSRVITTQTSDFYLNVSYDSSYINNSISATLHYNNTAYTTTAVNNTDIYSFSKSITIPTTSVNVNKTFYWTYIIDGTSYNTSSNTQEVYIVDIDDCDSYTQKWINITIRDELNDTALTGNIDYYFNFLEASYSGTFNNSQTSVSNFAFCMFPHWANFTTDMTLQYSVTGYDTRHYVLDDYVVDNATNTIDIYSLQTGLSTAITIHVVDEKDTDLEGIVIQAYKWDIDDDKDILVETESTDSDGNAVIDLQTGNTYYSFKFYENGEEKLSTSRFKLFATSYEYVLGEAGTNILGEWLQLKDGISGSITYVNNTRLVTFSWDDTTSIVDYYCLELLSANQTYYYNCTTGTTNSLSYTITELNISYTARGSVNTTTGNSYVIVIKDINTKFFWNVFGAKNSLLISILVLLTLSLLGLVNKNAAIIADIAGLITLFLLGILPIGMAGLVGIISVGVILLFIMNKKPTY